MSVSVCRQRIRKRLCESDRKGNTAPPRSSLASKTSKSSTDTNIRCANTQVMFQASNNATIPHVNTCGRSGLIRSIQTDPVSITVERDCIAIFLSRTSTRKLALDSTVTILRNGRVFGTHSGLRV